MALLEVRDLSIQFGGLKAVEKVSFDVDKNQIVGLIGPNGAGKTTVFNLLTNVYNPNSGSIIVDGKSAMGKKTFQAVDNGLARTFQNIRLFKQMSVLDNVKVGFSEQRRYGLLSGILRMPSYWKQEKADDEEARKLLRLFEMEDAADLMAGNLPYGRQRKLEICRAMATHPKVLLLDEPAAGMNPTETQELMDTIGKIMKNFDISILLIEHDMKLVMGICQKIVVLDYGMVIAQGTAAEVRSNKRVIGAYLGSEGRADDLER